MTKSDEASKSSKGKKNADARAAALRANLIRRKAARPPVEHPAPEAAGQPEKTR